MQRTENAIVVGEGGEIDELIDALKHARRAPARVVSVIRPSHSVAAEVKAAIEQYRPHFIIADFNERQVAAAFPELINYLSRGISFIDAMGLYEEVFGRIALSHIDEAWVARNVSRYAHTLYDTFKRIGDLCIALPAAVVSLVLYPFIALAIVLDSGRPVFIMQERIGEDDRSLKIRKFRSMSGNDEGKYGADGTTKFMVTRVGKFLRVTRLDELPQLWSIVRGDLAFVGPRPSCRRSSPCMKKKYHIIRSAIWCGPVFQAGRSSTGNMRIMA